MQKFTSPRRTSSTERARRVPNLLGTEAAAPAASHAGQARCRTDAVRGGGVKSDAWLPGVRPRVRAHQRRSWFRDDWINPVRQLDAGVRTEHVQLSRTRHRQYAHQSVIRDRLVGRQALAGVLRQPDFFKLWSGLTISLLGMQVSGLALPLTAVTYLGASGTEMGILGAARWVPYLAFGLLAGAWLDRVRRRPVLIATHLGRAVLLVSIPAAAALG